MDAGSAAPRVIALYRLTFGASFLGAKPWNIIEEAGWVDGQPLLRLPVASGAFHPYRPRSRQNVGSALFLTSPHEWRSTMTAVGKSWVDRCR